MGAQVVVDLQCGTVDIFRWLDDLAFGARDNGARGPVEAFAERKRRVRIAASSERLSSTTQHGFWTSPFKSHERDQWDLRNECA